MTTTNLLAKYGNTRRGQVVAIFDSIFSDALLYTPIGALISVACFNCIGAFVNPYESVAFHNAIRTSIGVLFIRVGDYSIADPPEAFEFPHLLAFTQLRVKSPVGVKDIGGNLLIVLITPCAGELLFVGRLSSAGGQENDEKGQEEQAAVHGEKETALGRKWQAEQWRK